MPPGAPVTWLDVKTGLRLPIPGFTTRRRLNAIARGLDRVSRDVDAFWCRSYLIAWAAARVAAGRPVVFIQTGPESPYWRLVAKKDTWLQRLKLAYRARIHDHFEHQAMHAVTHLVYQSAIRRDETLEIHGRAFLPKCRVVPHGVDLERFHPPPMESRRARDGVLRTITVCRQSPEKNVGCLIRAAALLRDEGVRAHSSIAGDGPMRAEWQSLARELGVDDRVEFLGHRADVDELLREADVFVLPSVYEGVSNAQLEAMASALPCVALRNAPPEVRVSNDEVIEPGRTGWLIDGNSPRLLADALKDAHANPERTREWGRNARRVCETRYTWTAVVGRLLELSAPRA
jgi:glycosyltransferase involved in cell wall biosynthesis